MTSKEFLPILLLLFLQLHTTCALQSNSTKFEFDLNNFNGVLKRGDNAKVVHELKKHPMYLGYLDPNNFAIKNYFDQHLEYAIEKYQEFTELNITGVIDFNMQKSIRKPRCGFSDFFSPRTHFKSLYDFYEGNSRWLKTTFKYYLDESVHNEYIPPIERALREWERATPFRFHQANLLFDHTDITVSFEIGDHGDAYPFEPYGPITAHSFRPPYRILHFNTQQIWGTDGDCNAMDVQTNALHEFGHILGLEHSSVQQAIMFAYIDPGEIKHLHRDDIDGIKALYGFEY